MIRQETTLGNISVGNNVITQIAGNAATKCFGVRGMAMRSTVDGLVHLLRRESMSKGVAVRVKEDGTLSIDLHIIVNRGVNLAALSRSIISEVRYMVSQEAETEVADVNVYFDGMIAD